MAIIEKRKRKKGIVYRVKIRIKGHPEVNATFDRLSEAHRWAEETEAALRSGGFVGDAPPGDMPFKEALDKYIDYLDTHRRKDGSRIKKPNTIERERIAAKALHNFFDNYTLRQITPQLAAKYRDTREQVVSGSTILKEIFVINNLYRMARTEWGLDGLQNPFADIRKPSQGEGRLRMLNGEEAERLFLASLKSRNKKFPVWVLLMLQSGMRPSEAAGLRWGQLYLDDRFADLTVTKTRPRRVPLTTSACKALRSIMPPNPPGDEYVFLPPKVSSYIKRRPNRYFYRAFKMATSRAKIKDFTQHDMRHTAASHLLMTTDEHGNRIDLITLSEILGHKTIDQTKKYVHVLMEHKIKEIERISGLGLS